MAKPPSERGFHQVMLNQTAYDRLRAEQTSATRAVLRLTSRLEQLEARVTELGAGALDASEVIRILNESMRALRLPGELVSKLRQEMQRRLDERGTLI